MTNAEMDSQIVEIDSHRPPAFTDEALALRFAERHADTLRYVAGSSKWFLFDGKQWATDDTLYAFNLSRRLCREASAECNKGKAASVLASRKTVANVEGSTIQFGLHSRH